LKFQWKKILSKQTEEPYQTNENKTMESLMSNIFATILRSTINNSGDNYIHEIPPGGVTLNWAQNEIVVSNIVLKENVSETIAPL
jgi:hypothetical protein